MFAPKVCDAKSRMTDAYQSIISLDRFSISSSDIIVVKLEKDPSWLPAVRSELHSLRVLSGHWQNARAKIWAPMLAAYPDYISTFDAFVDQTQENKMSSEQWINLLEKALLPSLSDQINAAQKAVTELKSQRSDFSTVLPKIDKSIQDGWTDLGHEEQDMLKLAGEIGSLSQLLSSYSAKLDSDIFSGGKSYVQSIVTLTFSAVAAGASAAIPVVGIATAVYSIAKSFYDIIEDNEKIIDTMNRISRLQETLSEDAVALALTKGTLQVLYDLEKQFLTSENALPEVVDMWSAEKIKVTDAINALKAGASPDQYLDLLKLSTAKSNWGEIGTFVTEMAAVDVKIGSPVQLNISKGTITKGKLAA